ncbi:MAG: hypothetical protein KDB23_30490, partial [Planctomycetales bacterium]|nr:hypothetical protein [Planctomycetales bacterium]
MSTAEPLSYEFTGVGTINVGIFLPNWVGDAVMATPTLRALRQHYGRAARITGIMRPHISEVLAGT